MAVGFCLLLWLHVVKGKIYFIFQVKDISTSLSQSDMTVQKMYWFYIMSILEVLGVEGVGDGGWVCAALISENNALISLNPLK